MYKNRLNRLVNYLKEQKLDAIIISKLENIHYFSGFTGDDSLLIISKDTNIIVTDSRYTKQASLETDFDILDNKKGLFKEAAIWIKNKNWENIGVEENNLILENYFCLTDELKREKITRCNLDFMRVVKDKSEIEKIKIACQIADEAFLHILKFIRPNMTEKDIAMELEFTMRKLGSMRPAFTTIVASGVRGALPHGVASDKIIQEGEFVTMDFGAVYQGYHSDITRTIGISTIDFWQRQIYDITLNAQKKVLNSTLYQMIANEVDNIARNVISHFGYGDYFKHGLGHGVGLEIHENPRISPKNSEMKLDNNMVFTVEPGIYLNDKGGLRIEDTVCIVDGKVEIMTKSPKELIIV